MRISKNEIAFRNFTTLQCSCIFREMCSIYFTPFEISRNYDSLTDHVFKNQQGYLCEILTFSKG